MKYKYDLTGQKFGKLTALYPVPDKAHRARWHCVCDCGNEKDVLQQNLSNGHVRSCGCILSDSSLERIIRYNDSLGRESHRKTKTRLYKIWIGMKSRCYYKRTESYKNYGKRGIKVCDEWLHSYNAFSEWALQNGYDDSLTIDRIDPDGNYCPENCRWTTMSIQEFNKRMSSRNTSGTTGVSYNKAMKKWVAYIRKDGKQHYLGRYDCIDDAIKARKDAEIKYFG